MIKLINKRKEAIVLSSAQQSVVNLYLCGPTVYGDVHVGNLRGSFLFDLLTKLLTFYQIPYQYYQNITDIDQKILTFAKKNHQHPLAVSEFYYQEYLKIFQKAQLSLPKLIKVSDHLDDIIKTVNYFLVNKLAYQTKTGIYFDSNKNHYPLPQNIKEMQQTQAGESFSHDKRTFLDFALWKINDHDDQFGWSSPWGKGLPGWHTECVVLLKRLFGLESFIIHGGGTDLYFPHHWNEKAQFKVFHLQDDAINFWLYNGLVNFQKTKISRSSTNKIVVLAKTFLKNYSANLLRFFFFLTPHQKEIEFNQIYLNYCQSWDKKITTTFKKIQLNFFFQQKKFFLQMGKKKVLLFKQFLTLISNNLNTVTTLDLISSWIKKSHLLLAAKNYQEVANYGITIWKALLLLGFNYQLKDYDLATQNQLLKWQKLVSEKNFFAADKIRQILQKKNIL